MGTRSLRTHPPLSRTSPRPHASSGRSCERRTHQLGKQVAEAYVQLRGAQALRATRGIDVRSAENSLALTENRRAVRLSTDLDVDQARTQLLTLQRQLPEYDKQEKQAIDRINLLIGKPPGTLEDRLLKPAPLPSLPNAVGVGLPSKLARRRPDIRQAKAQLHAATAGVRVAVADFYPDVSLTGNLGIRATDASYLTRWASHFYSAGPSLSLPIFEGGQLTANLRMNRAQAAEAALHYRATVLNALREVEDSLIAFNADRDERDRLAAGQLRSGEDTLYLSNSRYTHGLSDFLTVLDAQRSVETPAATGATGNHLGGERCSRPLSRLGRRLGVAWCERPERPFRMARRLRCRGAR